ncbi:conserved hypothetical protein [Candidatus Sulfopaludibacter sp. SbA3]|nr:conserved hypothetical protein [Candidatus Sulfopaludibacter sp. SbA3]
MEPGAPNLRRRVTDPESETTVGPGTSTAGARQLVPSMHALAEKPARAFEDGVHTARVIRLRGAHYMFLSNEAEVPREMRAILAGLK